MHSTQLFAAFSALILSAHAIVNPRAVVATLGAVANLPDCAKSDVMNNVLKSSCAITDIDCLCQDKNFVSAINAALKEKCSEQEQQQLQDTFASVCPGVASSLDAATQVTVATLTSDAPSATDTAASSTTEAAGTDGADVSAAAAPIEVAGTLTSTWTSVWTSVSDTPSDNSACATAVDNGTSTSTDGTIAQTAAPITAIGNGTATKPTANGTYSTGTPVPTNAAAIATVGSVGSVVLGMLIMASVFHGF